MKVLIACEFSQVVTEQIHLLDEGHEILSCDLEPAEKTYNHHEGNVLDLFKEQWDIIIAFPPCTHLAVSGSRWFPQKIADGRQQEGIDFFMEMINAPANKIAVENPVGIMSTEYRKPDQYIQPYEYGHLYTKKTGLWLENLPLLEPTDIQIPIHKSLMHEAFLYISDKKELAKFRNRFPVGIAQAMAEQWVSEKEIEI